MISNAVAVILLLAAVCVVHALVPHVVGLFGG
jgi:hypothetical protein